MRPTVRLRLAAFHTGLFLLTGVLLVAVISLLIVYSPLPDPPPAPPPPGGTAAPVPKFDELRRLLANSLIGLAVLAVVAASLGWFAAGRALRPVAEMTAAVRHITAERLDRRLSATGPDDELKRLADTFDGLLDRLQAAFTAQSRFIANASHELRTPLTLQRALAEVALADPHANAGSLRTVLERVVAAGKQQEQLIEALLTLARSQQGLHERRPVDLAGIIGEALSRRTDDGLSVDAELEPAAAAGDRALLERLAGNLLDNAVRHNVPGGWVRVATGSEPGRAVMRVSNSGPVIDPARVPSLLEPFRRAGRERRASDDGLGLGLSIVTAIVDAHGGDVQVSALPGGGLAVFVALPAAG